MEGQQSNQNRSGVVRETMERGRMLVEISLPVRRVALSRLPTGLDVQLTVKLVTSCFVPMFHPFIPFQQSTFLPRFQRLLLKYEQNKISRAMCPINSFLALIY